VNVDNPIGRRREVSQRPLGILQGDAPAGAGTVEILAGASLAQQPASGMAALGVERPEARGVVVIRALLAKQLRDLFAELGRPLAEAEAGDHGANSLLTVYLSERWHLFTNTFTPTRLERCADVVASPNAARPRRAAVEAVNVSRRCEATPLTLHEHGDVLA
jgi:hypothetical protein